MLRCYEPEDAPLLKDAVDPSLEHLRPWMPWARDEPQALDTVYERLRGFRGRFDLGEDYVDGSFLARRLARARRDRAAHEAGRGRARDRLLDRAESIGQGFATELSAVLTRVGFEHFGVDRIEIRVDPENERSEKVPRKLGFTHEATLRRRLPTKRGSDLRDVNVWTMFAAELASSPACSTSTSPTTRSAASCNAEPVRASTRAVRVAAVVKCASHPGHGCRRLVWWQPL